MKMLLHLAIIVGFGFAAVLAVPIAYPSDPNPPFPLFCIGAWIGFNLVLVLELPRKFASPST